MNVILDYLLNSSEHINELSEDVFFLVENSTLNSSSAEALILDWQRNKDNIRLDTELNYHKDPAMYDKKLKAFISKYL